ncbi:hypothetical protein [Trichocoleus sp. FACHB-46]|uniref:Uncharacterized protein n=2 Tax=Trichocoleus TaxID=450526 RepID=A0ABV0JBV2_9CYAN|nr:hypothetical protein [Trichocoleus sp. FACHB-46]
MKSMTKVFSIVGRWTATILFCASAIAFVWQGAFFSNTSAMAAPAATLIATSDTGEQVKKENKSFVKDAAEKVKETANKNASRVEDATDGSANPIQRKAQRDVARIEKRADEDAARTQKAIDNNVNAVERAVDSIKGVFGK